MPYTAEVSRRNPSCILFLIDQSGSMSDPFGGDSVAKIKADGVADAVNRLLQNLVIKCSKEEGVRDYYHVGVIGYGATVGPAFGGALAGRALVALSEVGSMPLRIEERQKKEEDGAGGLIERSVKFPVWFDPISEGGTPMCEALTQVADVASGWLNDHPDCFPPIAINITDGEGTDGDPAIPAAALQALASSDGNALLFNLHLSSQTASPVTFPDSDAGLADEYAKLLFGMSSPLPSHMRELAEQAGHAVSDGTRGFAFNANLEVVIKFLDIGTRATDLR